MIKHFELDDKMRVLLYEGASMAGLMEDIRREWSKQNITDCSVEDKISQCIMQMVILKIQSILKLCEGVPMPSYSPELVFLDSASIVALLRCIYEEVFIFHSIFATEHGLEKTILVDLWKIKGLNNQIFEENDVSTDSCDGESYLKKFEVQIGEKKKQVADLKCEIERLCEKLDITDDALEKICAQTVKQKRSIKGYELVKKDGKIVDFILVDLAVSPEKLFGIKKLNALYRLLSTHSHPTYAGLVKFGTMYNAGEDLQLLKLAIESICVLSAIFINDFLDTVKNGDTIRERLTVENKRKLVVYPIVN
jgi:hypothetical protein